MYILIIVDSVWVITILAKYLFLLWDFMEFQVIFTIIPPPVPWHIFISFGTYTSHLLCQLYFCKIFQSRHWPTVHDMIRLGHQIFSSVQTNIYGLRHVSRWDLVPCQNVAISDWKGKVMGMYKWFCQWRSFKFGQNIPLSSCWIIYLLGRRYNGIRSTKWRLWLNIWQPKNTEH